MTSDEQAELIFVYNASSAPLAQVFDFLHKTFSPDTYSCNLCRVTYGMFKARKEWAEFIRSLPYRTLFLHRDEFHSQYPALATVPLPAVFARQQAGALALLVSAEEINGAHSTGELKALLRSRLRERERKLAAPPA